jgi:hypothetical protein
MIPLKDYNPTSRFPVVTVALIGVRGYGSSYLPLLAELGELARVVRRHDQTIGREPPGRPGRPSASRRRWTVPVMFLGHGSLPSR